MRITITSKRGGYTVRKVVSRNTGRRMLRVDDGDTPLFYAERRTFEDYLDEKKQNECFQFCEYFEATDGVRWIYWRDEENNCDYLTAPPQKARRF